MIERRVIEKEEDGRLRDYTQYRIQPDVYEVLKPSYDQFYQLLVIKLVEIQAFFLCRCKS